LAALPFEVRLFYEGLWCQADKAGRLQDRPSRLKVEIFPYDNVKIERCLDLLAKPKPSSGRPFIHRYASDGKRYIQILTWIDHQKPHHTEAESIIPAYIASEREESTKEEKDIGTIKGTEKEKQLDPSKELRNGALTVIEPIKRQFLEFVMLTDGQYVALIERFGQQGADDRIAELNEGIGSKNYKYTSHYHTILSWDRKHKKDQANGPHGTNHGAPQRATSERNLDFSDRKCEGITVGDD